jgi:CRISPR/Cas system-associated endoribonuclease Cas2
MFDNNNPYATVEMLDHIRRERFDLILPRVMRERKIDMWIHVIRPWSWGGTDPLRFEFGSKSGVFIFTDRGSDKIERVVFEGEVEDPGAYDIVRGESKFINQENYEIMDYLAENPDKVLESELNLRFLDLREFVAERAPKRIAVNYSEELALPEGSETFTLALTDGISR